MNMVTKNGIMLDSASILHATAWFNSLHEQYTFQTRFSEIHIELVDQESMINTLYGHRG